MTDDTPDDAFPQSHLIRSLKGQIDELMLQLNLGKHEAIDLVEQQKGELRSVVEKVRASLGDGQAAQALRRTLDELQLQLALGRMESRDALAEQRGHIHQAVDAVKRETGAIEGDLRHALETGADKLLTKLDALALELGIGKTVVEDKLILEKDKVKADLEQLRHKIQPAIEETGDAIERLGHEAKSAFDDIRKSLRSLFD
jgi:hypothetical protein